MFVLEQKRVEPVQLFPGSHVTTTADAGAFAAFANLVALVDRRRINRYLNGFLITDCQEMRLGKGASHSTAASAVGNILMVGLGGRCFGGWCADEGFGVN